MSISDVLSEIDADNRRADGNHSRVDLLFPCQSQTGNDAGSQVDKGSVDARHRFEHEIFNRVFRKVPDRIEGK
jgi:hypothetical protein